MSTGGCGKWSPSTPLKINDFNECLGGKGSVGGNFGFSASFYSSGESSGFGGKVHKYIFVARLKCLSSKSF